MTSRPPSNARLRHMLRHPGGAIRIIGGQWKRTPLSVIDVPGLRPTPDRVRETVFNWLTHLFGGSLAGCSALDLFAGTGAMGLEAASRGASPVVLVERDHAALAALRAIATRLNATQVDVLGDDAVSIVRKYVAAGTRFSIIFLDPPFGQGWLPKVLPFMSELCNSTGVIYAESETTLEASLLAACKLELVRADKAGDVFYHLLRRNNNE